MLCDITIPENQSDTYIPVNLIEGNSYTIVYDGVATTQICHYNEDDEEFRIDTSDYRIYAYPGETISAIYIRKNITVSHTVKISIIDNAHIQLDEKYISYKPGYAVPGTVGAEVFNTKDNIATGAYSHAEGAGTQALEFASHAEGMDTIASKEASHAEGQWTVASGNYSHAEGYNTIASGHISHAEGYWTTASGRYSHAQGKYNIEDTENKYAHIIGNGADTDERSNAHTIDWNGVAWFAGDVKVGGTGQDDANAKTLATTDVATAASDGLMSSTDKAKLDSIGNGTNDAMPKSGGTFTGPAYAQANANHTTYQLRNIAFSTSASTPTGNGSLLCVYS